MRQGSVHCQIIGFGIDIDHIIDVADLARSAKGKTRCKIVGWRRIRSKCCGDLFYRNGGKKPEVVEKEPTSAPAKVDK